MVESAKPLVANRPIAQIDKLESILVRGVNWLGDAVMTTPALQRLRQRFPSAQITLLTHEKLADLWPHHPCVNSVITFTSQETIWSVARRLAHAHFQLALLLPNSPRSALEAWLARIPQRIGYGRYGRNWLLTHPITAGPGHAQSRKRSTAEIHRLIRTAGATIQPLPVELPAVPSHQFFQYLHLAASLGSNPEFLPPYIAVSSADIDSVRLKFGLQTESERDLPIFCLNPGAEYGPAKRWPAQRFAAVALEIQRRMRCRWLILGGPSDASLANELAQTIGSHQPPALNLAGKTSLRELCAVLKLCGVLLTNDTGPMHLAAAVGTPVVALFGSTSPELTSPGLPGVANQQVLTILYTLFPVLSACLPY